MTGQVINQGRILINPFRTFGFFSISGDVVHDGTEIRVEDSSKLAFFGKVSGGGDFTGTGVAAFEGGYSPGNSPDGVSFAGDVEFGAGNTLGMELGGLLRGTEYDALDIAGTATLGGLLDVALWNDFTPEAGDAFDLIVARAISGQFSGLTLPVLQDLRLSLSYLLDVNGLDIVRLTAETAAVPVPAVAWLRRFWRSWSKRSRRGDHRPTSPLPTAPAGLRRRAGSLHCSEQGL